MNALAEKHVRVSENVDVHVEHHYDSVTEESETLVILKTGDETILRVDWFEWTLVTDFVEAAKNFEH